MGVKNHLLKCCPKLLISVAYFHRRFVRQLFSLCGSCCRGPGRSPTARGRSRQASTFGSSGQSELRLVPSLWSGWLPCIGLSRNELRVRTLSGSGFCSGSLRPASTIPPRTPQRPNNRYLEASNQSCVLASGFPAW